MQTVPVEQLVGKTLGGYHVERFLGRGRVSAVYLARHTSEQIVVALTLYIMPEYYAPDACNRFIKRFRKEAAALTTLKHPHLLPVYEYGEYQACPYLVTPYMMHGSLADQIKRRGRLRFTEVLEALEQVTMGLEYAHQKGVVHGTLKPANLIFNAEQSILVAGFGLMHILQQRGIEQNAHPYAHLFSITNSLLAPPEYLAPEVVEGYAVDRRSDVYALGIILFELLHGKPPFTGSDPLFVAQQHVQRTIPSLHTLHTDIPVVLASVVNQALERDPDRRFQSTNELFEAFAQAVHGVSEAAQYHADSLLYGKTASMTEQMRAVKPTASEQWQFLPPIVTGKLPAASPQRSGQTRMQRPVAPPLADRNQVYPQERKEASVPQNPPVSTNSAFAPPTVVPLEDIRLARALSTEAIAVEGESVLAGDKTGEWWMQPGQEALLEHDPYQSALRTGSLAAKPARTRTLPARRVGRRRVVAALAAGAVVVGGSLFALNLNQNHLPAMMMPGQNNGPQGENMPRRGQMIGSNKLALNTAQDFKNPLDGKESLLIHLPNGKFVAYEKACPHAGVFVKYDPNTHLLVCPAHNAVFDPARGAAVLQGPATKPLAPIKIRVTANGIITLG